MGKGYDPKCYELAEYFSQDIKGHEAYAACVSQMAQHIQDAVEDFELEVPHDAGFAAIKSPSRMCPECKAVGGPDGATVCDTCAGGFWEDSSSIKESK
jgi:hypothetical protein